MLAAIAALGVGFAIAGDAARRACDQRSAVTEIESVGGTVRYSRRYRSDGGDEGRAPPAPKSGSAPSWLERFGGDHLFVTVDHVFLIGPDVEDATLGVLMRLRDLKGIHLLGTKITDIGLGHVANIQSLTAIRITTEIPALWNDGSIKRHGGTSRTPISDEGLKYLGRLPRLEHLDVSYSAITDAGLRGLIGLGGNRALRTLVLDRTGITDEGLNIVARLPAITAIGLSGCAVTDDGVARLLDATELEELWLDDTPVSDVLLTSVARRGGLRVLSLAGTRISDEGALALSQLSSLRCLILDETNVSIRSVAKLVLKLRNLEELQLRNTAIDPQRDGKALRLANPFGRILW